MSDALDSGEGYVNLADDTAYKGQITLYPDWVTVETEHSRYTVPRRRVDFINWKEIN